jgi:hypothetical protein
VYIPSFLQDNIVIPPLQIYQGFGANPSPSQTLASSGICLCVICMHVCIELVLYLICMHVCIELICLMYLCVICMYVCIELVCLMYLCVICMYWMCLMLYVWIYTCCCTVSFSSIASEVAGVAAAAQATEATRIDPGVERNNIAAVWNRYVVPCQRAPRWVEVAAGQNLLGGSVASFVPTRFQLDVHFEHIHPPATSASSAQPCKG